MISTTLDKKLAREPYSAFEPHIAASAYGWLSD
ncbi:hypothetical protein BN1007_120319 [Klebsiella variicola]|nr:hypothetical protein BN1007_120319 [Klebsiella variicola]